MSELRERVVARLLAAQESRDPAPLRAPDAVDDALALLREAAPAPQESVDLDSVAAVFWTFWFRHLGPDDPDAQQNMTIAAGAFGFLRPRVPQEVPFPPPLQEAFDAADPAHDARFAYLVSSAHGGLLNEPDTAEPDRLAAVARALAWSDTARSLLPDEHTGQVEVALQALGIELVRFQWTADPEALAAAARHGRTACERIPSLGPDALDPAAADAVALALGTVVDAARLLGEPSLPEVERLVAIAPEGALVPQVTEGLRSLRELHAEPEAWTGQTDLRVGMAVAGAGAREHDAGRIACAVRPLRRALGHVQAGQPAHALVTVALSGALDALARERGDAEAAREAAELLAAVAVSDLLSAIGSGDELTALVGADIAGDMQRQVREVLGELRELGESPEATRRLVDRLRERAAQQGALPDITLETTGLLASFTTGTVSDQQIARYRTALSAVPDDEPQRYACVAVLAALTGLRAQELREFGSVRAARLDAEARSLAEQAAAAAPDGLDLVRLLRNGSYDAALPIAALTVVTGEPDGRADPEIAGLVSQLVRMADVRLDSPEQVESSIAIMRELLDELGEDDTEQRAYLSAALGSALSSRAAALGDPTLYEEAVPALRYACAHASDLPADTDQILAQALTVVSATRLDTGAARETAALLAAARGRSGPGAHTAPEAPAAPMGPAAPTGPAGPADPADPAGPAAGGPADEPTDLARTVMAAHMEFHNALQLYVFGHEPDQLDRAREIARRIKGLGGGPLTEADRSLGLDLMGDALEDLVDSVGPGGGPASGVTDALVDRCRRRFAECPPGHRMRIFAAMTLQRVLAMRALDIRDTDPERAGSLMAEAGHLIDTLGPEAGDGWADVLRPLFAMAALGVAGPGHLPPISPGRTPDLPPAAPASPFEAIMEPLLAPLRNRLAGVDDPGAHRDARVPVLMRAHGELGSAAGALRGPRPDVERALSHLEAAVELLPGLTDRGSDQRSAEHGLTSFEGDIRAVVELILVGLFLRDGGARTHALLEERVEQLERLVSAAGSGEPLPDIPFEPFVPDHSVTGPDVDRAAELLERGRGLLLSRRIESRADLGALRLARPDLAREFETLTDRLGAEHTPVAPGDAERVRFEKFRTSGALDELIDRIRAEAGFDGFLRPLTAEQLRALATEGPVVVLNHGRRLTHAVVVTDRSITSLILEPKAEETADAARRLREAVDVINAQGPARRSPAELIGAGAEVRRTLSWTWHKIVRPVLERVGAATPVAEGGPWPRIWWVPTGAFNTLPLHAAQCTGPDCDLDGCGAALDAVVSSYVPGFQTLAYARSRAEHRGTVGADSALLVASPEEDLPGVAAAARYAAGLLKAPEPLVGAAATRAAVLPALGGAAWAHFGCHAATDPAEPSGGLLRLPSGEPLSVLEICRAQPRAARLAFLAACGTARTAERLSDEAIHITSAFLLAGFPTAVGTLWEIDGTHADRVSRDFYRRTASLGFAASAHALHQSVRELRRRAPSRPHVWAAYVHAGV